MKKVYEYSIHSDGRGGSSSTRLALFSHPPCVQDIIKVTHTAHLVKLDPQALVDKGYYQDPSSWTTYSVIPVLVTDNS